MTSLLDLMGKPPRPAPRPIWRNGQPVPGSDTGRVTEEEGDQRWLTTAFDGQRWRGAWFRWDTQKAQWVIIDPDNRLCINHLPDQPPRGCA